MYGSNYKGNDYDAEVMVFDNKNDKATPESVPLKNAYEWGSNSMVINNAIIEGIAYKLTNDTKYLDGVVESMDYIFGRNPLENSYITGYGVEGKTTANPHHRYWCHQMKNTWPYAPNGCLSGGPNSNMNDPMIQGAGYKIGELAPMKCYYDQVDAWSVNEITTNWNSPVVWISSFMEDNYNATPTPQPSENPTDSKPEKATVWGDADESGDVDILDVIQVNKFLLGVTKLSAQGTVNADVNVSGDPDSTDSLNILKLALNMLSQADMPIKK